MIYKKKTWDKYKPDIKKYWGNLTSNCNPKEQQTALSKFFESPTMDERAIQRQCEKIERTEEEIAKLANGERLSSRVPAIETFLTQIKVNHSYTWFIRLLYLFVYVIHSFTLLLHTSIRYCFIVVYVIASYTCFTDWSPWTTRILPPFPASQGPRHRVTT